MFETLGSVQLKSGERVEVGLIAAPDAAWADRLEALLGHKGDIWNWQNQQTLRHDLGVEVFYYVLHRGGVPFANIMTVEVAGVGILGHVWTAPADRRQGATSLLMRLLMAHFRSRGGRALHLGTGFDSPAYHIYAAAGFQPIPALPRSGIMDYHVTSRESFERQWFAAGETQVEPLSWRHWPLSEALFLEADDCYVRCAARRMLGPSSTEEPFLRLLRLAQEQGRAGQAQVLRQCASGATVGLASWEWDPLWPEVCLVDLYCHRHFWSAGAKLLSALPLPAAQRYLAYADSLGSPRADLLRAAGFRPVADLLRGWKDAAENRTLTLTLLEKQGVAQ